MRNPYSPSTIGYVPTERWTEERFEFWCIAGVCLLCFVIQLFQPRAGAASFAALLWRWYETGISSDEKLHIVVVLIAITLQSIAIMLFAFKVIAPTVRFGWSVARLGAPRAWELHRRADRIECIRWRRSLSS